MMVENNTYPGDPRVRREATTLAAAGYQVSVISPARPDQASREVIEGVRVFRYRRPRAGNGLAGFAWEYGYSMLATWWLTLVAFFQGGFDVIHCHNPPDLFVFIALPYKLLGKKFVFDHHDLSPEMYQARLRNGGNPSVVRVLIWLEKFTCRWSDHVIATNESYKQVEMQRGGVPEEQITVVRNGPDLNRIRLVEPDPELRARARTILGFVGVMGFQDGVDYLLRALHYLREQLHYDDFYCVLIGKGDAVKELQRLTAELKLEQHVCFAGPIPDAEMLRCLCTADICVDSDPYNPFNDRSTMIKMTEYMALAKPIVAFDLTEHRATAAEAALYAQPNDEQEFARLVLQLAQDAELRERLGEVGRERVDAKLAWHHQQPQLLAAYEKLFGIQPQAVTMNRGGPDNSTATPSRAADRTDTVIAANCKHADS